MMEHRSPVIYLSVIKSVNTLKSMLCLDGDSTWRLGEWKFQLFCIFYWSVRLHLSVSQNGFPTSHFQAVWQPLVILRDPPTVEPRLQSPGDVIVTVFRVNTFTLGDLHLKRGHSGCAMRLFRKNWVVDILRKANSAQYNFFPAVQVSSCWESFISPSFLLVKEIHLFQALSISCSGHWSLSEDHFFS